MSINSSRFSDIPSSWRRFVAHSIDEIVLAILCIPFFIQVMIRMETQGQVSAHWALVAYFVLVRLSYDTLSLYFFQATIGKKIMGLKVVSHFVEGDREGLSFWQSTTRALGMRLCYFFSWAPYAFALSRYDRTHLLDWMAGTRVQQIAPQPKRMSAYPIWSAILVVYFIFQGLEIASRQVAALEWRKPDLIVSEEVIPVPIEMMEEE